MRKLMFCAIAIAIAGPAAAADMRPRAAAPATPAYTTPQVVYNWTGFYIGGHVGGAFAGDSGLGGSGGRLLAGIQGGADYQFANNWVMGVEAQYSWLPTNDATGTLFSGGSVASQDTRGLGSVTGRLGYAWGPALLYAKGGYAFRDSSLNVASAGAPAAFAANNSRDGYTVGAGLEYMFAPNWSAKVEYQYYDFGKTTFTAGPADVAGASFRNDEHTVKAGLNYRFGWGGPAVSRY